MTVFNYTVNYIDVILVALMIIFTVIGYKRGLTITLLNFIKYTLGFSLSFFCAAEFASPVYDSFVRSSVYNSIEEKIAQSTAQSFINDIYEQIKELPGLLKGDIDISVLENFNSEDLTQNIMTSIVDPVLLTVTRVVIFIVVAFVFFLISSLIIHKIRKKRDKKKNSPLKTTDKLIGGIIGFLKGTVIVLAITMILMYIVNLNDELVAENGFLTEISQSSLVEFLDKINPFNALTMGAD